MQCGSVPDGQLVRDVDTVRQITDALCTIPILVLGPIERRPCHQNGFLSDYAKRAFVQSQTLAGLLRYWDARQWEQWMPDESARPSHIAPHVLEEMQREAERKLSSAILHCMSGASVQLRDALGRDGPTIAQIRVAWEDEMHARMRSMAGQ